MTSISVVLESEEIGTSKLAGTMNSAYAVGGTIAYSEYLVGAALRSVKHDIKIDSKFGTHHNL